MKKKLVLVALLGGLGLLDCQLPTRAQPVVTTLAASGVAATNATLNGTVNPESAITTAYFQYGLTTNYGNVAGLTNLPATNITLTLPGLAVNSLRGAPGTNWTASSAPGGNWQSIVSSANGTRLAAVIQNGGIYISTNSGVTWALSSAPTKYWHSITASADGTRLASACDGGVYTSPDGGVTWTQTSASGSLEWYAIAASADDTRLAAVAQNGGIYTSTNSGVAWTLTSAPSADWYAITASTDGTRLAAVVYEGGIYTSTNFGVTWTLTSAPNEEWLSIAGSANSTRLVAGTDGGGIYASTNSGVTWTLTGAPSEHWYSLASSVDGLRLAAAAYYNGIYTSLDGGVTWRQTSMLSTTWYAIASSADGSLLAAAISGGGIYTSSGVVSNLTPATVCHYRAVGLNIAGTALGSDLTFVTSSGAPSVTTLAASGVTSTNATLNGLVNPNGPATTAYFQYGLTTSYGSYSATNTLAATNVNLSVADLISNLAPGVTYHFQLVADNSAGTNTGADVTVTTSASTPIAATLAASGVTATTATLNGTVNPQGGVTTVWFQYGLTTGYGSNSATNTLPATNAALSASNLISSLAPGTTYHYRVVAGNSAGTNAGADLTVTTTPAAPAVTTLAASDITATGATVNGQVNPNGAATTAYFQYGLTTSYGSDSATNTLVATNVALSTSSLLSGLSPGTTYHFQLVADNSAGTNSGGDLTVTTTPAKPAATTLAASGVTATTLTLNGLVNPQGGITAAYFRYGLTTSYGSYSATNTLAATNAALPVASLISSLSPGTTYHFQLVARNSAGTNAGGDLTVTTTAGAPAVATAAASGITNTSATLNGVVNPNGAATTAYFEYGLTTSYGSYSATNTLAATNVIRSVAGLASSLAVGTTYHFQLVANNSAGTSLGADLTFTTTPGVPLVTTLAATGVSATNATLNGTVNPEGGATTAYFQFGLTTNYGNLGGLADLPATNTTLALPGQLVNSLRSAAGAIWQGAPAPFAQWQSITASADGQRLAAVINGGGIYTSTNAGATWTQQAGAPSDTWQSIASSADGLQLTAVAYEDGIYTSPDGGVTWTEQPNGPIDFWESIASSADGLRLAAVADGGGICTSPDGGVTWTYTSAPGDTWQAIAASADGTRLAAVANGDGIYTSPDGGITWTYTSAPIDAWQAIAASVDGARLAAVAYGDGIYTSTNAGVNWTPTSAPVTNWEAIASSADGLRLAAVVKSGGIYTSTNSGVAWTQASLPSLAWQAIASSADGTRLAAAVSGESIITSIGAASNLIPGTVYHYQAVGLNSAGISLGSDLTFTTSTRVPTVTTLAASGVSATNATLRGAVNPQGGVTTAYFQYGLTTNYGSYSATNTLAATNLTLSVADLVSNLAPGTVYHFQLMAGNSAGTNTGADLMFTTVAPQPLPFNLTGPMQLPGGAFQLSFTNASGVSFTVLATTNLALPLTNWTVLGVPGEAPPGQYQFTDPQAATNATRFYRVRSP